MANIIKIKRGLKADINNLSLLPGELGVALDTQELYVGDQNGNKQLIKSAAAGVVEMAEKLSTPRNISVSGDATGSTSFDGSTDATIALTLASSGVTAGTYNNVTVNAKGIVTAATNKVYEITDIDGLEDVLAAKANASEVYKKTETYTQTEIDNKINAKDSLPSQTGHSGKFLTTNGTTASWGVVDLSSKANASEVYTKTEIDGKVTTLTTEVNKKANSTDVYTKGQVDTALEAKANQSTTYTKSEVDGLLDEKANSATTLLGYGITDAYTKSAVDTELAKKADATATTNALNNKADKTTVSTLETTLTQKINNKADKATTLAGYGIGDAYTKTEVDGMVAGTFHFKGEKASLAELEALTGMKEGDVYQVGEKEYAYNGSDWIELGFNVDLSAYAKTADVANTYATKQALTDGLAAKADSANVYTKGEVDTKVTTLTNNLNNKANSADVYTKTQVDTALNNKANKSTTLAGYGITNAYTKTEVEGLLDDKADAATTLAGYQISDAYTKTEVNTIQTNLQTNINTKLDANSVIDGGTFGPDAE